MASHAYLTPSSAHRWLHCAAAPRLESFFPDETSPFATEGTTAHAAAAEMLTGKRDDEKPILIEPDMAAYVEGYVSFIEERLAVTRKDCADAELYVERRLDLTKWIDKGFGTADAAIVGDGTLEIIDLKYGKGVKVRAKGNEQLRLYALGAVESFGADYAIDRVRMTIYQPRLCHVDTEELSTTELRRWADETLMPGVARTKERDAEATAGDWCRFCRASAQCRAVADTAQGLLATFPDARLLKPEELAGLLSKTSTIKTWCGEVEQRALSAAVAGTAIPGYKLVEGKSRRVITDEQGLHKALLDAGYERAKIEAPAKLIAMTAIEKYVGRKEFAELAKPYLMRTTPAPTLAPDDDPREAFGSNPFKGIEIED